MRAVAAVVVAVLASGCARGPQSGGAPRDFTRLVFRVQLNREVNPNYLYYVAIRATAEPNPDPAVAPLPVIAQGTQIGSSPNGFVAGQPTHFIEFNALGAQPYTIYRFRRSNEVSNPTDPTNPIELSAFDARGVPFNFVDPRPNQPGAPYGRTLGFTITTRDIADTDAEARALRFIQVNILTMNRKLLPNTSGRLFDSLGDNRDVTQINQTVRIPVNVSRRYQNFPDFNALEPTGNDELGAIVDPDLDFNDWSIEVQVE